MKESGASAPMWRSRLAFPINNQVKQTRINIDDKQIATGSTFREENNNKSKSKNYENFKELRLSRLEDMLETS